MSYRSVDEKLQLTAVTRMSPGVTDASVSQSHLTLAVSLVSSADPALGWYDCCFVIADSAFVLCECGSLPQTSATVSYRSVAEELQLTAVTRMSPGVTDASVSQSHLTLAVSRVSSADPALVWYDCCFVIADSAFVLCECCSLPQTSATVSYRSVAGRLQLTAVSPGVTDKSVSQCKRHCPLGH